MSALPAVEPRSYFKLFACCLAVRGAARSLVCDVQRGVVVPISNALYDLLSAFRETPVEEVLAPHPAEVAAGVRRTLAAMVEKELGFWCQDPAEFPDLDLSWDRPAAITNAIVELSPTTTTHAAAIVSQLGELGCEALELRSYRPFPLTVLRDVIRCTERSRLESIELLLCHSEETTTEALLALCRESPRINRVVVHSAPTEMKTAGLHFRVEPVRSSDHCGYVDPGYFSVSLAMFAESQSCNTCLNRKVAVDGEGHIRNCPAMPASYGNIAAVALRDATAGEGFRSWWTIRKDDIEVCRDCEFRHVCTDCRALLSDPTNRLSKPLHCHYDPYTARWGEKKPHEVAAAGTGS
jgi:SPASM domain peptide maturase of grasp-with-spasm system